MRLYLPITVDLYNIYPLPIMKAQQYNIGRGALVTIVAAGQMVIPDNESLYIYAKKKDGTKVYANCTLSGNQVQVDFNEQMTAVAGILQMELQMIDQSGNNITTPIFLIDVQKSIIDYRAIVSSDDFQVLQEALAEVEELKKNGLKGDPGEAATIQIGTVSASAPGSSPQITNSGTESAAVFNFILPRGETGPQGPAGEGGNDRLISDAFSEEKAYAVGDYAIYENVLYKFTAAKTAGAWDATKVQAVTVAGELNSLNGNLGGFRMYHSLTELGINSPSTMTYQDFVNNMPENSILVCYLQGISFAPNSSDGCALFVKCTGSAGSKKIVFETTSMSGASSDFYMARYSAAAGTQWTGWIQIPTNTQLNAKFKNMFKTVTGSKQYNVGAGLGIAVTNISYTVPEGYKAVGPIGFYTGSDQVFPLRLTHNRMDVRNVSTGSITATATITVLCVKNF